ncbi:CHAT domain-containing protein [Mycena epipterygia]|nr:CHAT domain-containing protein [Mycena epipterygia]
MEHNHTDLGNIKMKVESVLSNSAVDIRETEENTSSNTSVSQDVAIELFNTAHNFFTEYKSAGNITTLNSAVYLLECAALSIAPDGPHFLECLNLLGKVMMIRFLYTGQVKDAHHVIALHAIPLHAAALESTPDLALTTLDTVQVDNPGEIMKFAAIALDNFHREHDRTALEEVIGLYQEASMLLPDSHSQRWRVLCELSQALLIQFHLTSDYEKVNEAILHLNKMCQLKPSHLLYLQAAYVTGYQGLESLPNTIAALKLLQQIKINDWGTQLLTTLGMVFYKKFELTHKTKNLDNAVKILECAESMLSLGHHRRELVLLNLRMCLFSRAVFKHDVAELDSAIKLFKESLPTFDVLPGHLGHCMSIYNLALAMRIRFQQTQNKKDLYEAMELDRAAARISTAPPSFWVAYLNNLATAIINDILKSSEFQTPNLVNVNRTIEVCREALKRSPTPHSRHSQALRNLATALAVRLKFEYPGDLKDSNEEMKLSMEHMETWAKHNLTSGDQQGDVQKIDEAIESLEKVAKFHAATEQRFQDNSTCTSSHHHDLAEAYFTRFNWRGDMKDLDDSLKYYREAFLMCAQTHSKTYSTDSVNQKMMDNLRQSAMENPGRSTFISLADMWKEFPPHADCIRLPSSLVNAYYTRFEQLGDPSDILDAFVLSEMVLNLYPASHSDRGMCLANVGNALLCRNLLRGNLSDINTAIEFHKQALQTLSASHPCYRLLLHGLASSLSSHFEQHQHSKDLDDAIILHRQVLDLSVIPLECATSLDKLAMALDKRFQHTNNPVDVDEALSLCRRALSLCIAPHRNRAVYLTNFSTLLHHAFSKYNNETLDDTVSALKEASTYPSSSAHSRLRVTYQWIDIATTHNHSSLLEAHGTIIKILKQIAAFYLDLESRRQSLTPPKIASLATESALCAINQQQFDVAVEFLEASRSIFWAQLLALRVPLDGLTEVSPELAAKLMKLSTELEEKSFRSRGGAFSMDEVGTKAYREEGMGPPARSLEQQWNDTVASIQALPNFENFLAPLNMDSLRKAAVSGPVVILLAAHTAVSCSALIVKDSGCVQHVQLSRLNAEELQMQADFSRNISKNITELRGSPDQMGSEIRPTMSRKGTQNTEENLRKQLEDLWTTIVRPVFDALNLVKNKENPPRLWWCPTGPFAFSPIHAAGIYRPGETDCVSDYVISSYTPTLAALLNPPKDTTESFHMTAVIVPNAPNCRPLPGTSEELTKIKDRVPRTEHLTAIESSAGVGVVQSLNRSSVIHFACHGVQDSRTPLNSGFILWNGRHLTVSQIIRGAEKANQETQQKNTTKSLAFLSACETAKGDQQTPDEAMHLAATLLFAGFRGVVATMWQMNDNDGPEVADTFYEHLFRDCDKASGHPDPTKAAEALHFAVAKLREEPGITFMRWVPFVHYGI